MTIGFPGPAGLNRANSFHELWQVPIVSDPREVKPVGDIEKKELLAAVIKEFASYATSQEAPQVQIITGQMGAGKSTATNNLSQKLGGNCLIVDYDELKRFVPGYTQEAGKGYPGTVPGSKEVARYLEEGLKNHGFANKLNMVIQKSINSKTNEIFDLVKASKDCDYHVSLTVLAVDKSTSTAGIFSRYESGLKSINQGEATLDGARRTPMEYHQDAYDSLVDQGNYTHWASALDEVIVIGRSGEIYYQSIADISPEKIVDAIELGRKSSKAELSGSGMFETLSSLVKFNLQFKNPELRDKNS